MKEGEPHDFYNTLTPLKLTVQTPGIMRKASAVQKISFRLPRARHIWEGKWKDGRGGEREGEREGKEAGELAPLTNTKA
jgi:hypothetical protein